VWGLEAEMKSVEVLIETLCPLNCPTTTHPQYLAVYQCTFGRVVLARFCVCNLFVRLDLAGSNADEVHSRSILLPFPGEGTLRHCTRQSVKLAISNYHG
jgi:hypothetical protein